MRRASAIILATVVCALAVWMAWQYGVFAPWTEPPNHSDNAGRSPGHEDDQDNLDWPVEAPGRLEPAGGIINIAAMAGDRVETIEVEEGAVVHEGDVLAYLESRPLRKLEYESLECSRKEAVARREAERVLADKRITAATLAVERAKAADKDIKAQTSKVDLARANRKLALADKKRLEDLRKTRPGLVSDQEWERQRLLVQRAQAECAVAEAMLDKAVRTKELGLQAAQADLKAAQEGKAPALAAVPVESLTKQRDLAKEQYDRTEVTAPCGGTILKIFTHEGETITHRPILQLGDLTSMVVVAEVYETDARRVRPGQKVLISSSALPEPHDRDGLVGHVGWVAGLITTPELKSLNPLARSDRRVVEVRVELDKANSKVAAGLVNLQVDVRILPDGDRAPSSERHSPQEP